MGFVNAGRSEPPGTEHKLHNAIRKGGVATAQERPVPNEVARPPSGESWGHAGSGGRALFQTVR